jgi:2-polyprenyl-3-methyl-5-hydroxy-6-metoxy-1,4-benzoquinol methylase
MQIKRRDYVLGHTAREQTRLIRQARALAPATDTFFRAAGLASLASGMRVLDIGCGMGDVTMLVAQLVGLGGEVVSIDLDQASIDTALKRVSAMGLENVTFRRADISTFTDARPFDAIVGRLVLEFLPNPVATIARLAALLRPGGIMAFQEPSWKLWLEFTAHLPLRMAVTTLIRDTFLVTGANTEMELPLYRGFKAADLTSPQLQVELPVGDSSEFRGLLHDLLLAVWDRALALRLPLESLGDPATLASAHSPANERSSFSGLGFLYRDSCGVACS